MGSGTMRLWRHYSVTLDNWTPLRMFWTLRGAKRFMDRHPGTSYLFCWDGIGWQRIGGTSKG